jgi:hypothetical protein
MRERPPLLAALTFLAGLLIVPPPACAFESAFDPDVEWPPRARAGMAALGRDCSDCHGKRLLGIMDGKRLAPTFGRIAERYSPQEMREAFWRFLEEGTSSRWSNYEYVYSGKAASNYSVPPEGTEDYQAVLDLLDWLMELAAKRSAADSETESTEGH